MVQIRHMERRDADAASALLQESWRQTYGPIMGEERAVAVSAATYTPEKLAAEAEDDDIIAFVAEDEDGAIVGYAMAYMDHDRQAWLDRLHVAADHHGAGVATNLLHAILAAHAGLPSIALEVMEGNDRAIAFYSKHGFIEAGHTGACGGLGGVPALIMKKLLPRA